MRAEKPDRTVLEEHTSSDSFEVINNTINFPVAKAENKCTPTPIDYENLWLVMQIPLLTSAPILELIIHILDILIWKL